MKRTCCAVVFPKGQEWRYCRNRTKFKDMIGRGWCWKHMPNNFIQKAWKMMKETGIAA